jgi:hypothetical protein
VVKTSFKERGLVLRKGLEIVAYFVTNRRMGSNTGTQQKNLKT